jgi:hypothetical protein
MRYFGNYRDPYYEPNPLRGFWVGFVLAIIFVILAVRWFDLESDNFHRYQDGQNQQEVQPVVPNVQNEVKALTDDTSVKPVPNNIFDKIKSDTSEAVIERPPIRKQAKSNQGFLWVVVQDDLPVHLHPNFKTAVIDRLKLNSKVRVIHMSPETDQVILKNNEIITAHWYYVQFEEQSPGWVFGAGLR